MRRPHRNIEIFSMSVLDMFASALGAFIMCSVILFPYFRKDVSQEVTAAKATLTQKAIELDTTQRKAREVEEQVRHQDAEVRQVRDTQARLNVCKDGLNQCQVALAKNFLLVQIGWSRNVNVDLHVIDPEGHEFYWAQTNRSGADFPQSKAQLSTDSSGASGAGVEVWVDPEVNPGVYKVDYVVDRAPSAPVPVTGLIFDRFGQNPLPVMSLQAGTLRVHAATLQIAADGSLTIH